MFAETDSELYDWTYGVIFDRPVEAGGFLHRFCAAATSADEDNYALLRPVLLALKAKYPKYSYKERSGG